MSDNTKVITTGSRVKTANGYTGIVHRIDTETYSIPMYLIDVTDGRFKGERICVSGAGVHLFDVV